MKSSIIYISILFLTSCGPKSTETAPEEKTTTSILTIELSPEQMKRAGVETGIIESRNISSLLQVNGIIDVPPQNMIAITFPPGGYLKSTKLLPGMHIRKGDVLAVMEDPGLIRLQQEYLTAVVNGNRLEEEYKRQKELNQSKSTSEKLFQEAEAAYKTNKISIRSLSEQLQLAGFDPTQINENTISRSVSLRSPIDGYVTGMNVNVGTFVNPGDILFHLVDPRDIHLNLTIFEKDIRYLGIGQKVKAWTNSAPDEKHEAEIILIGKDLDEHRSAEVHCHFRNYDKDLLPGMFMNASIEIRQQHVPAVEEEALVTWKDKPYIFQVDDQNRFTMISVTTGMREGKFIEIKAENGKELPATIVTKGAYTLLMQLMNKEEE